jgi:hypothetical protein
MGITHIECLEDLPEQLPYFGLPVLKDVLGSEGLQLYRLFLQKRNDLIMQEPFQTYYGTFLNRDVASNFMTSWIGNTGTSNTELNWADTEITETGASLKASSRYGSSREFNMSLGHNVITFSWAEDIKGCGKYQREYVYSHSGGLRSISTSVEILEDDRPLIYTAKYDYDKPQDELDTVAIEVGGRLGSRLVPGKCEVSMKEGYKFFSLELQNGLGSRWANENIEGKTVALSRQGRNVALTRLGNSSDVIAQGSLRVDTSVSPLALYKEQSGEHYLCTTSLPADCMEFPELSIGKFGVHFPYGDLPFEVINCSGSYSLLKSTVNKYCAIKVADVTNLLRENPHDALKRHFDRKVASLLSVSRNLVEAGEEIKDKFTVELVGDPAKAIKYIILDLDHSKPLIPTGRLFDGSTLEGCVAVIRPLVPSHENVRVVHDVARVREKQPDVIQQELETNFRDGVLFCWDWIERMGIGETEVSVILPGVSIYDLENRFKMDIWKRFFFILRFFQNFFVGVVTNQRLDGRSEYEGLDGLALGDEFKKRIAFLPIGGLWDERSLVVAIGKGVVNLKDLIAIVLEGSGNWQNELDRLYE